MVTGSGLGGARIPQNLGRGQKECPGRNILGPGRGLGIVEKTKGKLTYQFSGSLPSNDKSKGRAIVEPALLRGSEIASTRSSFETQPASVDRDRNRPSLTRLMDRFQREAHCSGATTRPRHNTFLTTWRSRWLPPSLSRLRAHSRQPTRRAPRAGP